MKSCNCDIFNVDVHRASYAKHLKSKKHIENEKQNEMVIPDWFFRELVENKIHKIYTPKSLKRIALENIKLDVKQLNKELAKKMINPYYFNDRTLRTGFNITLESHHFNHANSKLIVKPNYPEFGNEICYINKIIIEICSLS